MEIDNLRPPELSHVDASCETFEAMLMRYDEFDRADLETLFIKFEEQENE